MAHADELRPLLACLVFLSLVLASSCVEFAGAVFCDTSELVRIRSEESGLEAYVELTNCGATTGYMTEVVVAERTWYGHRRIADLALSDRALPGFDMTYRIRWTAPRQLEILCEGCYRQSAFSTRQGDVQLTLLPVSCSSEVPNGAEGDEAAPSH